MKTCPACFKIEFNRTRVCGNCGFEFYQAPIPKTARGLRKRKPKRLELVARMTADDAIVYLRQMREEYANKLARGINPGHNREYVPKNQREYLQTRIQSLDTAVVLLAEKSER